MDKTGKKMSVKSRVYHLGQSWFDFAEFVKSHPILAGITAAFLALVYAGQAFSNYFYIDKEQLVNNPGSFYNWNEIGRFGLILVKKLLNLALSQMVHPAFDRHLFSCLIHEPSPPVHL